MHEVPRGTRCVICGSAADKFLGGRVCDKVMQVSVTVITDISGHKYIHSLMPPEHRYMRHRGRVDKLLPMHPRSCAPKDGGQKMPCMRI